MSRFTLVRLESRPRVVSGIVLVLTIAACHEPWPEADVIYIIPRNFSGWICVDFDVKTASSLPREGKALIVRPRGGEIIQTSDNLPLPLSISWSRFEDEPPRPTGEIEFGILLPDDVVIRESVSMTGPNEPFRRSCEFLGTVDQTDAAGNPPGFVGGRFVDRPVSSTERAALIALYETMDGPNWRHKVGWLGPSGTECRWHGVDCETQPNGPTTWVTKLSLRDDALRGTTPESLGAFERLETLSLPDDVTGPLPAPLVRRWLAGDLEVFGITARFTHITEIEFEHAGSESACDRYQIIVRADRTASGSAKRCLSFLSFWGGTGCDVKEGWIDADDFARLAHTIEQSSYFSLKPEYRRDATHAAFDITRVTRNGRTHQVSDYASAGPQELQTIRQAIASVRDSVWWTDSSTRPSCPAARLKPDITIR